MTKVERYVSRALMIIIALFFMEVACAICAADFHFTNGFGLHYTFWHWMGLWNIMLLFEIVAVTIISIVKPEWLEKNTNVERGG